MARSEASGGRRGQQDLALVGIGSMVLDRMHRTRRLLGPNEKGLLDSIPDFGPVQTCIGGVLLNQLGWARLFGISVGIFGRQADDDSGRVLRAAMKDAGIETHLDLSGEASSLAEIFVDHEGERAIYMAAGATATLEALRVAHEHGLATVVDLDVLPSDAIKGLGDQSTLNAVLREADLLKPTTLAARELFPEIGSLPDLVSAIRNEYGISTIVLTDGENGSLLGDAAGNRWVAAYSIPKVVDSTGAGDAFFGGFLAGEALGLDLEAAAKLGNACGAACVEQMGAFPEAADSLRERALELYDGPEPSHELWKELT